MSKFCSRSARWLVFVLAALSGPALGAAPVGLDALRQFEQLDLLRPDAWAYQASSHDRSGHNQDWTGILGIASTGPGSVSEKIMMDVAGPGCIYRIWMTSPVFDANDRIRVYLDGSATATVDIPLDTFFSGTHPWFPAPLVGNAEVSSGGYYCYVPMLFRTGCRVTYSSATDAFYYYNITYHRYVSAEGITTYDGSQNNGPVLGMWNNTGEDPKPDTGTNTLTGTATIASGGSAALGYIAGSGVIQSIELNVPAPAASLLASLRLQMAWDSLGVVVDAPLGAFFGSALAPADAQSLPIGMVGSRLYCYFPMPFRYLASISLKNNSTEASPPIGFTVRYTPTALPANVARFRTAYSRRPWVLDGVDHNFVTVNGSGLLVGVTQTTRGKIVGQSYLEGDERFYVDGGLTPALHGTGTDHFYNAGGHFENGTFSKPLHGHPFHLGDDTTLNGDDAYRFFLGDAIPFRRSLRAGIEYGAGNDEPVDMETVAFYYRHPRSTMYQTDAIDIGQPSSETAHAYSNTVQTWSGRTAAYYEGTGDRTYADDGGRWLGPGGTSELRVSTDPPGGYVVLRRRLNYGVPRQQAEVRVDGTLVGTWYDAGSNAADGSPNTAAPAFRDSEFFIPPSISRAKKYLDIEIRNVSTESDWTEYYYWVFVVHDGSTAAADFDYDGDVDQEDFAYLQQCLSGYSIPQPIPFCASADLDGDSDADDDDVELLILCYSGPGVPVDSVCADP